MVQKVKKSILSIAFILFAFSASSQFLMDMIDTTKEMGKGMLSLYKRYDHIRISGYMQPQYQVTNVPGVWNFSGGDFSKNADSRFMLRRGRIRFDYARLDAKSRPQLQLVFQFDGTERGVFIRDFWARVWENKWESFAFTTGMFARPFGFEVNYSSSDREAPERGRMSQILMKTERDLGFMVSYEPRKKEAALRSFRIEGGFFNGQGLSGPIEFDGYKDFIGQIVLKPVPLGSHFQVSGGVSFLNGGMRQDNKYTYRLDNGPDGSVNFLPDSVTSSIGDKVPRKYYGINAQFKYKHGWGATEIRGEYWQGTQSALQNSTETPGVIPALPNGDLVPFYVRKFNGAFLVFLQNIINIKHQIVVKYDWYDPNTEVSGMDIGKEGNNLNAADIRNNTLGFGYIYYFMPDLKLTLYYEMVRPESSQLEPTHWNQSYNILTCRLQFRF